MNEFIYHNKSLYKKLVVLKKEKKTVKQMEMQFVCLL